mmetsp:Transcript_6887/g.28234  ORF Transcript_6887/g.28234 Transcript_6887/m.28234 type:complete len:247 (-) Transcript_6887:1425-2165(-)
MLISQTKSNTRAALWKSSLSTVCRPSVDPHVTCLRLRTLRRFCFENRVHLPQLSFPRRTLRRVRLERREHLRHGGRLFLALPVSRPHARAEQIRDENIPLVARQRRAERGIERLFAEPLDRETRRGRRNEAIRSVVHSLELNRVPRVVKRRAGPRTRVIVVVVVARLRLLALVLGERHELRLVQVERRGRRDRGHDARRSREARGYQLRRIVSERDGDGGGDHLANLVQHERVPAHRDAHKRFAHV